MINHSENNRTNLSNPSSISKKNDRSQVSQHSWSINHQTSEVYLIFVEKSRIRYSEPMRVEQICLLIYNLDNHKIIKTYTLNFNALKLDYLRDICTINMCANINSNESNIPYKVISNWIRNNDDITNISMPDEVYILINRFYSFCSKTNVFLRCWLHPVQKHWSILTHQLHTTNNTDVLHLSCFHLNS